MNKLKSLWIRLHNSINAAIDGPPLEEVVNIEYLHALEIKRQTLEAIHKHEYILHMVETKIEALDKWCIEHYMMPRIVKTED